MFVYVVVCLLALVSTIVILSVSIPTCYHRSTFVMPWWAEPRGIRQSSCVCVCACVSAESFPELVLRICRKLSAETCNASLMQYYLEMKLVDFGLMALLWSYGVIYVRLLTLTAVFRCPESVEEQPAYNGLLSFQLGSSICTTRQTRS